MPYDLSNIGLAGQQAFYTRMATAAQAENLQSNTAKDQFELEQAQRMQELSDQAAAKLQSITQRQDDGSSNLVQDPGDDQAGVLDQVGQIFLQGGAPKQGSDFLKAASDIRNQQSEIEKRTSDMQKARLENIQKGAQIVGTKLGKARNQSEWDQGLREVEQAGIIEPHLMDQLKSMPYDPDVAAYFYDQSISAAEQARIDLDKHTQERIARQNRVQNEQRERQMAMTKARDAETQRWHNAQNKNGGTGSAIPPKELVTVAKTALAQDIYKEADLTDPNHKLDYNAATNYIAAQAQQILRGNKAIDADTAVRQAIIKAKQAGAFSVTPGSPGWFNTSFGKTPSSVEFKADGLQPETAHPLPPGIKSAAQAKQMLKAGQWYNTTRGPAKWNGSAWEQP